MDEENKIDVNENTETDVAAVSSEDKHQKFLDTSLVSVRKASAAIEKIGKCANIKQYEYSEEEVGKMFAALQQTLDDTKKLFCQKQEFTW